ncbi:MAG: radical SAM protein [Bacteroidaceae bacterium]|nr:radical SAM protein [Bacteroidaceae bacterium]
MATVIYPSPIFGPIHSRRLGVSLGINLLPADGKICSFDCIYCECGLNAWHRPHLKMPSREQVRTALEARLQLMSAEGPQPDVLTFAGNGEPTLHPHFPEIIDDTIRLRDQYFPAARISVLSNATQILRPAVHAALLSVDNNILKLDTVNASFIQQVDCPGGSYDVTAIVEGLKAFHGHVIIQTMFLCGTDEAGNDVNNTGDSFVEPWLSTLLTIVPEKVMIYTIDRETPVRTLQKASPEILDGIAERVRALGLECSVAY